MSTKRHHPPTRPFGTNIGLPEDDEQVLERLRAGFVTPTMLKRTVSSLVAHLQSVAKPDSLSTDISDEEKAKAQEALDLLVKIYRESKAGRGRV